MRIVVEHIDGRGDNLDVLDIPAGDGYIVALLPLPQKTPTLAAAGQRASKAETVAEAARRISVSPGMPRSSIAMRSSSRTSDAA